MGKIQILALEGERSFYLSSMVNKDIVSEFTREYYDQSSWAEVHWLGYPTLKCPLDLWVYQEILYRVKPQLIIECGTWCGGTALFLAHLCEHIGIGHVLSIDWDDFKDQGLQRPSHERISYVEGNDADPELFADVSRFAGSFDPVLVILDSDHREDHVYRQLGMYSDLVTIGSYLIVEDTVQCGPSKRSQDDGGPAGAVERFLREDSRFEADRAVERHLLTFNPGGYLRRIS